ncbi:hypothetical protein TSTA_059160 [Talaromyces stipitatus ATCC 10500]|uniref:Uncharacterized protein n=1 Tax=Talaromyces stipitatus (strain ATCC 10500 / CBS 375.48 / QM 6759 / NRRL 1006) TaxID=441959 RepID=B8MRZ2_TALSN|nr:uncharacterized protein TSTA_059160 [Talaromyces stipitatus ATCC 10500]EED13428.1 hypothetical protein TSTA_059160 [Talaromyces stipitatus ATCC 10500]
MPRSCLNKALAKLQPRIWRLRRRREVVRQRAPRLWRARNLLPPRNEVVLQKGASIAAASKTSSPTKRGKPSKAATASSIKAPTKAKAKGRPSKSKAVVVASTAESGSRSAKSSPQKTSSSTKKAAIPKKAAGAFPSRIGDIIELSSPEIEELRPDLAKDMRLGFLEIPHPRRFGENLMLVSTRAISAVKNYR